MTGLALMKVKCAIRERKSPEDFLSNDKNLHDSIHNFVRDISQFHGINAKSTQDSFENGVIEIEERVDMAIILEVASKNCLICQITD